MAQELMGLEFLKNNMIENKKCDLSRNFAFISYAHDEYDANVVKNVFVKLYERGFNLWIDIANIPKNEDAWYEAAQDALMNENNTCKVALFFRSEESLIRQPIYEELEMIKELDHIKGGIITIDIWHKEKMTAESYKKQLIKNKERGKLNILKKIFEQVSPDNSAWRIQDVDCELDNLVDVIANELEQKGVCPSDLGTKYYIEFMDGDDVVSKITAESGKTIESPSSSKDGYKLIGWYFKEDDDEKIWNFDTDTVNQNLTLIARWEPIFDVDYKFILLQDFIKKYGNNTFNKSTFSNLKLVGNGEYAKYGTGIFDSTYDLAWEFVMNLLKEKGIDFINEVNTKHAEMKNPVFIEGSDYNMRKDKNKYRNIDQIPSLSDYYMYRHFGQYDWIYSVLRPRMEEFGLPINAFGFLYDINGTLPENTDELFDDDDPPMGPSPLDKFEYTLWEITHTANKMVDMLNDVFDLIAEKYPGKIKNIAESDKITAVARKIDLEQGTANDSKIRQFSNFKSKEHPVNGDIYCVNAGYNRAGCIKQIERMLILCDENPNVFKITKEPEKSTRSVTKSGKEGLGEMLD